MGVHILEVEINAEGSKLAYLSPVDENGEPDGGYRIAGPKPWGGSRRLAKLEIPTEYLVRYIKNYAPDVLEGLKN